MLGRGSVPGEKRLSTSVQRSRRKSSAQEDQSVIEPRPEDGLFIRNLAEEQRGNSLYSYSNNAEKAGNQDSYFSHSDDCAYQRREESSLSCAPSAEQRIMKSLFRHSNSDEQRGAVLNKVEGANHHSMVLRASRGVGMTAYLIVSTKPDKERTSYLVSREEERTAYPPALEISNKEERTAF